MKACQNADLYQALKKPTCNAGDPCDTCKTKWARAYQGPHAHEWQSVTNLSHVMRLRVPGGWIYKLSDSSVFVPWDGRGPE